MQFIELTEIDDNDKHKTFVNASSISRITRIDADDRAPFTLICTRDEVFMVVETPAEILRLIVDTVAVLEGCFFPYHSRVMLHLRFHVINFPNGI